MLLGITELGAAAHTASLPLISCLGRETRLTTHVTGAVRVLQVDRPTISQPTVRLAGREGDDGVGAPTEVADWDVVVPAAEVTETRRLLRLSRWPEGGRSDRH